MITTSLELLKILGEIIITSWLITRFAPLQMLVESIPSDYKTPFNTLIMNTIKLLLSCGKCCSFWFGLIWSHNFFIAALSSLLMVVFEKYILRHIERPKF